MLRSSIAVAWAWAGVLLVLLLGCEGSPQRRRVLLVGIDGASPRLTSQWIDEGLLTNLGEIARTGVFGPLKSHYPLLSPRVWTSVATGKSPVKHGIENWIWKNQAGKPRLFTSADRKVHALWNIASDSGLTVGVVNWLNTHPPEKIAGVMISDFAIPGERRGREGIARGFARKRFGEQASSELDADSNAVVTYPEDWEEVVEHLAANGSPLLDTPNPFVRNAPLTKKLYHPMLARTFRNDDLAVRIALEITHRLHPDILMVYLPGIDRVCHFFWGALEPDERYPERLRFSPPAKKAAAEAIRTYYKYTDQLIGKLQQEFGPDDLVLIISDHGFEAWFAEKGAVTGGHDTAIAEDGVIFARGRGISPGVDKLDVSVNDITPTILAWLGLPIAKDMDGRPASFLSVEPTGSVATFDTTPIERVGEAPEGVEEQVIDHLRALGYVD